MHKKLFLSIRPLRLVFFIGFQWLALAIAKEPSSIYLTWVDDPSSTMTIQWLSPQDGDDTFIKYKKEHGGSGWLEEEGSVKALDNFLVNVHTVHLKGLEPGEDYTFQIGEASKLFKFRTMPIHSKKPVCFVVAGDAYYDLYLFRKMNLQIAKTNPDFVVVGGDIAYTNGHSSPFKGKNWEIRRWGTFFNEWNEHLVTSDGRLIPMLIVIGNHDIKKSYVKETDTEPVAIGQRGVAAESLFYDLFAMPTPGTAYRVLDFGDYLSLFLLDTGHSAPIGREQSVWLEHRLDERSTVPNKMAAYHVAAYPSVYRFDGSIPAKIRKFWVPLFEKYHLQTAFEHHNHAYKRTFRLKEGKIHPEGVVYLGDGAWGVSARKTISAKKTGYLASAAQKNCFWQVTIADGECVLKSFDINGRLIEDLSKLEPVTED